MKARHLIESTVFRPQALQVAFRAFDLTWGEMAAHVGNDQRAIESAHTAGICGAPGRDRRSTPTV